MIEAALWSPFWTVSTYIGRCIETTSQGVLVRSTEASSFCSHVFCAEPGMRFCSLLSWMTYTGPIVTEYQSDLAPDGCGGCSRPRYGTLHSPPPSGTSVDTA
jgi:hypothetical protein